MSSGTNTNVAARPRPPWISLSGRVYRAVMAEERPAKKTSWITVIGGGFLALIVMMGAVGAISNRLNPPPPPPVPCVPPSSAGPVYYLPPSPVLAEPVAVGETGHIRGKNLPALGFLTQEGFENSIKAIVAKDTIGFQEASRFALPIELGTSALVIESTWTGADRVRVLGGPYKGKALWIAREEIGAP